MMRQLSLSIRVMSCRIVDFTKSSKFHALVLEHRSNKLVANGNIEMSISCINTIHTLFSL